MAAATSAPTCPASAISIGPARPEGPVGRDGAGNSRRDRRAGRGAGRRTRPRLDEKLLPDDAGALDNPARRLGGDGDAAARRDGGERRPAGDPRRPRRQLRRDAVGHRRLRADPGRDAAQRRGPGRPDRPAGDLRRRAGRIHRLLGALRGGELAGLPRPRPRRPGRRRRCDVRLLPRAARQRVPGQGARLRPRRLGRRHRRCARDRTAGRRGADRRARLALDIPRQPADWRPADLADSALAAGVARAISRARSTSPGWRPSAPPASSPPTV